MGNCAFVVRISATGTSTGQDRKTDLKTALSSTAKTAVEEQPDLRWELEEMNEAPRTISAVLSQVLYAMEFQKFLATRHCCEQYEFFQAVNHYREHWVPAQQHRAVEASTKIYNLYVAEEAPLRVALDEADRIQMKEAIDSGNFDPGIFDSAHNTTLRLMEQDSLPSFLESSLYANVKRRVEGGELEKLMQEDIEAVKDIMSKEFLEYLGDPSPAQVLSTKAGVDWFRKYLVIEYAEEGLDLWVLVKDMLARAKGAADPEEGGAAENSAAGGGSPGPTEAGKAAVDLLSTTGAQGGEAGGGSGEGGEVGGVRGGQIGLRVEGQNLFSRFMKSGCGMECNLPGTVIRKVATTLENPLSTDEEIFKVFMRVEQEIFKLLAYDPFLRFKRSGMYTKYCMESQLKVQRTSLSTRAKENNHINDVTGTVGNISSSGSSRSSSNNNSRGTGIRGGGGTGVAIQRESSSCESTRQLYCSGTTREGDTSLAGGQPPSGDAEGGGEERQNLEQS